MHTLSITQAEQQLDHLVELTLAGEEVVITRYGRPIAKMVALVEPPSRRIDGASDVIVDIAPDFNAPLSESAAYPE